jgi:hypothetical protein
MMQSVFLQQLQQWGKDVTIKVGTERLDSKGNVVKNSSGVVMRDYTDVSSRCLLVFNNKYEKTANGYARTTIETASAQFPFSESEHLTELSKVEYTDPKTNQTTLFDITNVKSRITHIEVSLT